ncbi:MAG: class II aldolase/adducin family protein [Planctomycetaceae bacterium]|jgi:L-fuculose-phosphate aldolase|nr:class II aldolase/adducin family protein [Planctomycetaceae bacterium]
MFNQSQLSKVKDEICDIGRRIYNKGFAAANDGNISFRIDDDTVVCTPTQVCKGFLKPDDVCIVDMDGNQIVKNPNGRKRTSEVMLHLTVMKKRPEVKSVVHCHPPHATAFGIAREAIPQCVLPEVDIYMGDVPIAKYGIPGGQELADTVLSFIDKSDIIVLANHGTVSVGPTIEKAYWLTELLDAYCRILLISRDLGKVEYFNKDEAEDLLRLKTEWGIKDARSDLKNCELCANDVFRESWKETGVAHRAFQPPTFKRGDDVAKHANACGCTEHKPDEQEQVIQAITERVMQALKAA